MTNIITITREFGSGGRTVGKLLAAKLGYNFYDKDIDAAVAEESGLSPDFISESGEDANATTSFLFNLSRSVSTGGYAMPLHDRIFVTQCKVIKQLAANGPCVIVGHCADYILRDRNDCLNVFIYADMESRAKRVVGLYGETEKSIEKRLKEKDDKRKVYYKNYTEQSWGRMQNYHVCLDSGRFGTDKCVEIIEMMVEKAPVHSE